MNEGVCVKRTCGFDVNGSTHKAGEKGSIPFYFLATFFNEIWAKVVYSGVGGAGVTRSLGRSAIF